MHLITFFSFSVLYTKFKISQPVNVLLLYKEWYTIQISKRKIKYALPLSD